MIQPQINRSPINKNYDEEINCRISDQSKKIKKQQKRKKNKKNLKMKKWKNLNEFKKLNVDNAL
jgi:hypothetical protein